MPPSQSLKFHPQLGLWLLLVPQKALLVPPWLGQSGHCPLTPAQLLCASRGGGKERGD